MIDNAENRYKFSRMLDNVGILQPQWKVLTTLEVGKTEGPTHSYTSVLCMCHPYSKSTRNSFTFLIEMFRTETRGALELF